MQPTGSAAPQPELIVPGGRAMDFARRTREVYFRRGRDLCAAHVDTKAARVVAEGLLATDINCDETFVVGAVPAEDPTGQTPRPEPRTLLPQRERMFGAKLKQGIALTAEEEASARRLSIRLAEPYPVLPD
jgi:hypothetical protein